LVAGILDFEQRELFFSFFSLSFLARNRGRFLGIERKSMGEATSFPSLPFPLIFFYFFMAAASRLFLEKRRRMDSGGAFYLPFFFFSFFSFPFFPFLLILSFFPPFFRKR